LRHASSPEQTFGAGTDTAEIDVDDDIVIAGRGQLQRTQSETLGLLEHYCSGTHLLLEIHVLMPNLLAGKSKAQIE